MVPNPLVIFPALTIVPFPTRLKCSSHIGGGGQPSSADHRLFPLYKMIPDAFVCERSGSAGVSSGPSLGQSLEAGQLSTVRGL